MSKEILKNIIENFSTEKFIHFFRNKNTSFRPIQENLFNYNDEDFTLGEKIVLRKNHLCTFGKLFMHIFI